MKFIKSLILVFSFVISFTGCFDREKTVKYEVKISTNKELTALYGKEDFEIRISKIGDSAGEKVSIVYNDKRIDTGFDVITTVAALGFSSKLNVLIDNVDVKDIDVIIKPKGVIKLFYAYISADNNMASQSLIDLEKMRLGTIDNPKVKVFAYINRDGEKFNSSYLVIENGEIRILKNIEKTNTGDVNTLKNFISYGKEIFEPQYNIFLFWNHGDGWYGDGKESDPSAKTIKRAIGFDQKYDDWLNLYEMEAGLKSFGKKWDMIIFDACLMNGIEVLYQIRDLSKLTLGSAEEVPMGGYDYNQMLHIFSKEEELKDIGIEVIQSTIDKYNKEEDFATYSLIDNSVIDELNQKINLLADNLLKKNLEILKNKKNQISNEVLTYSQVENNYLLFTPYVDLKDFCRYLLTNKIAESEANELINSIQKSIVCNKYTDGFQEMQMNKSGGLNIYLPIDSYDKTYSYVDQFAVDNRWGELVRKIQ